MKVYSIEKVSGKSNQRFMTVNSPIVLRSYLVEVLKSSQKQQSTKLVLLGGCSRSGKSYLANLLKRLLEESGIKTVIVELDGWLVSKDKRKPDSSVLERYKINRIVNSAIDLLNGTAVYPPVYDSGKRERVKEKQDSPMQIKNGIIILDGVVALAIPELLNRASFRIFVDVPDTLRRERMAEFYLDYKNVHENEFQAIMGEREREEVPFIKASRRNADVVFSYS